MRFEPQTVTGEDFVGREKELSKLSEFILPSSAGYRTSVQVHGLNRIGKTCLINEAFRRIPAEDIGYMICPEPLGLKILRKEDDPSYRCTKVFVNIDLQGESMEDFASFLRMIISRLIAPLETLALEDRIPTGEHMPEREIQALIHWNENRDDPTPEGTILNYITSVFRWLSRCNVVLTAFFDECDDLANPKLGDTFGKIRSWLGVGSFQIITVSRLCLATLETMHGVPTKSTISGLASSEVCLFGFTNEEMDEYFKRLEAVSPEPFDEETRRNIWHYCGRVPAFLSFAGESLTLTGKWDANGTISQINKIFQRMTALMNNEGLLDAAKRAIFGLAIRDSEKGELLNRGFAVSVEEKDKRVYVDYIDPKEDIVSRFFVTVSPYFRQYLTDNYLLDKDTVNGLLGEFEAKLRFLIFNAYVQFYGDSETASEKLVEAFSSTNANKKAKVHEDYAKYTDNAPSGVKRTLGYQFLIEASFTDLFYRIWERLDNEQRVWDLLKVPLWYAREPQMQRQYMEDNFGLLSNFRNSIRHTDAGGAVAIVDINQVARVLTSYLKKVREYIKSRPTLAKTILWKEEVEKNVGSL